MEERGGDTKGPKQKALEIFIRGTDEDRKRLIKLLNQRLSQLKRKRR